jgi:hypothetical protein
MIRYDCVQGSPEWLDLHIGRPSASGMDKILTVKTRKPSAQAEKYAIELCAGWLLGQLPDAASSGFMARGLELEAEAVAYYEFTKDVTVDRIGFCTTDDGRVGCSPDFLVGDDGGGEIKCLSAVNHVGALLGAIDDAYVLQVQACLWVTGRTWWDRVWFNPAIQPLIIRVERDEETIGQLAENVEAFLARLDEMKAKLLALGCKPQAARGPQTPLPAPQTVGDALGHPPERPAPSKHDRAVELAAAFRALPAGTCKESLQVEYMLTVGDLERSIEGLTDSMVNDLAIAIRMEEIRL